VLPWVYYQGKALTSFALDFHNGLELHSINSIWLNDVTYNNPQGENV